jgi:hypothetical protein
MAYGLRKISTGTADSMTLQADGTCTLDVVVTQMSKPAAGGEPRVIPTSLQITTSTATKITTDPANDNDDLVTEISIANIDASITSLVTLTHKIAAGTARTIFKNVALKPGDHLEYGSNGVWMHYDQTLGVYTALAIALSRTTILSGSGTYTPPVGCRAINVRAGGGGGGAGGVPTGSSTASVSGGGGSGGYREALISPPASSYSYAVGPGGNGGAAGANAGTAGTDTTFGSITAKGGTNAAAGIAAGTTVLPAAGGAGGTIGSGGDFGATGEPGTPGLRVSGTAGMGGNGGSQFFGSGGAGATAAGAGGNAAANSCAGGGGSLSTSTAQAGGNGGSGIIVIDEMF